MMHDLLHDVDEHIPTATIAAKCHHSLVEGIVAVVCVVGEELVEDTDDVGWLKRVRRKPIHYRALEDHLAERNP